MMSSDRNKLPSVGLYFLLNLLIRMMDDATVWIVKRALPNWHTNEYALYRLGVCSVIGLLIFYYNYLANALCERNLCCVLLIV